MLNCNYFLLDGMSIILDICEKWIEGNEIEGSAIQEKGGDGISDAWRERVEKQETERRGYRIVSATVFMHLVRISAAVFTPVYIRIYSKYQYSIFVSLDIRAGRTQRRKESEFAIRVSGWGVFRTDFASPSLILYWFAIVFNVSIIGLFSHQAILHYSLHVLICTKYK